MDLKQQGPKYLFLWLYQGFTGKQQKDNFQLSDPRVSIILSKHYPRISYPRHYLHSIIEVQNILYEWQHCSVLILQKVIQ